MAVEADPLTGALLVSASLSITGVSTDTNQTSGNQKTQIVDGLGNVIGATTNALDVNIKSPATLPVSAVSLPLPSGAATSALQTTGNSSLSSIDGKITAVNTGAVVLAAGTALIGRTASSDETSTVYNGTTALTPKFATIAASTSGNNTIVAAVTSKKIRVLALQLVSNGTVNVKWQSGAAGTDLTGLAYLIANTGMVLPYSPVGWFETAVTTLLNLNLSAAIAVGGSITYVEV